MSVPDRIERELTVAAPQERVWASITEKDLLSRWFSSAVDIDLRPGGAVQFRWEEQDITSNAVIEEVDAPQWFVYRWETSLGPGSTTRVEFELDTVPEGTRLRLTETGFAGLPAHVREGHEEGWDSELGERKELVEARVGT